MVVSPGLVSRRRTGGPGERANAGGPGQYGAHAQGRVRAEFRWWCVHAVPEGAHPNAGRP